MAQRVRIHRLIVFALAGWAGLVWMLMFTGPEPEWNPPIFYLLLGLALFGTFSLGAFAVSFVVFHTAAQRGNLGYASEQGLLLTALVIVLMLLGRNHAISLVSLLILLATFILWQGILLFRVVSGGGRA